MPYKSEIIIDPSEEGESFVDKMAHFKRIRLLEDSHKNNGNIEDLMYFVKKVDKKAEIISESVKHQILSEFTAFICVEKELLSKLLCNEFDCRLRVCEILCHYVRFF